MFSTEASNLFLQIWGRWSEVTTKSEHCERFPGVLLETLPSIKERDEVSTNRSSPKIAGGLFQSLLIQYTSERVSLKKYSTRELEKSWLSLLLTISWTGLNWLSKLTTRNITEKYIGQKNIIYFSSGKLLSMYNWNKICSGF